MKQVRQWLENTVSQCAHWYCIWIPVCKLMYALFKLRRMRFSFSVNYFCFLSICELKENLSLTIRAQEPKWPKQVILADCAYGDSEKMRLWVSQCADKSCAHIVYNIYIKYLNTFWCSGWSSLLHKSMNMGWAGWFSVTTRYKPYYCHIIMARNHVRVT
jgi:hypothetical protein